MDKYTISEIERKFGYSNSKIRRLIKKKVLPITTEKRDNRDITIVLVEDEAKFRLLFGDRDYQSNHQTEELINHHGDDQIFQKVEEAEIVKESPDYQLMSMEQSSFDELIQNIKDLADDRSRTEKESYKKLEDQYFSLQAETKTKDQEIKMLIEEIHKEKLNAAQIESESKIKDLRIKELEEKLSKQEDQQLTSSPWWSKKL